MMISIGTRSLLFAYSSDSKSASELAWNSIDALYDGLQRSHQMVPKGPQDMMFREASMLSYVVQPQTYDLSGNLQDVTFKATSII